MASERPTLRQECEHSAELSHDEWNDGVRVVSVTRLARSEGGAETATIPKTETMPRLTLRIDFDEERAIGPGKIKLLELIDALGSISAAGRQMDMSYRRAWLLVDSLNRCFREPLVASHTGGAHGGGASLTPRGVAVVRHYRATEVAAHAAVARHLDALVHALADPPVPMPSTPGSSSAGRKRKKGKRSKEPSADAESLNC